MTQYADRDINLKSAYNFRGNGKTSLFLSYVLYKQLYKTCAKSSVSSAENCLRSRVERLETTTICEDIILGDLHNPSRQWPIFTFSLDVFIDVVEESLGCANYPGSETSGCKSPRAFFRKLRCLIKR